MIEKEFKFCEYCEKQYDIDDMIEYFEFGCEKYACFECFGIEQQGYPELDENGCEIEDEDTEFPGKIY